MGATGAGAGVRFAGLLFDVTGAGRAVEDGARGCGESRSCGNANKKSETLVKMFCHLAWYGNPPPATTTKMAGMLKITSLMCVCV